MAVSYTHLDVYKRQEYNKRHHETLMKLMDSDLKNRNETLDSTSEGIKASPNTEENLSLIHIWDDERDRIC